MLTGKSSGFSPAAGASAGAFSTSLSFAAFDL